MELKEKYYPHKDVLPVAMGIEKKLQPFCHVINIAGSLRRNKEMVGDIEIVCVPKLVKVGAVDLFGEDNRAEVVNADFINTIKTLGKTIKGKPDGRMMQIELHEKIMLDLFMPEPYDYWRVFAIRTGSGDYSQKVIATGWLRIGWCGTPNGLRLQSECEAIKQPDGKTKWKCITENPTLPPVWESEKDFFDWMGVQWLPPNRRSM